MAGKRKGRGTVSEPRRPGTEGEKGERGKEQDTANWLEWIHAGRRERETDIHHEEASHRLTS
jgi:hypothetical protein